MSVHTFFRGCKKTDLRLKWVLFRPKRADVRPERVDFRPGRVNFRPNRALVDEQTDKQMAAAKKAFVKRRVSGCLNY